MDIKEFLFEKYMAWQKEFGQRRTLNQFAQYLDVPPTSLSTWMNGPYVPKGQNVGKLAAKLGPEIYEILGIASSDVGTMTAKKRQVLQLLDDINDDQETERVIAELEARLQEKHRK